MTTYDYSTPVGFEGVVYRSQTEAKWAQLFTLVRVKFSYEPDTFQFPDGTLYTPDFRLSNGRYLEIKNRNVTTEACRKANMLAAHMGSSVLHDVVLIDGSPHVAKSNPQKPRAIVFDGRPPVAGWEARNEPVYDFGFCEVNGTHAAAIIGLILQPTTHGETRQLSYSQTQRINQAAKNQYGGLDYYVSLSDVEDLRGRTPKVLDAPTPEMLARYDNVPERRMPIVDASLDALNVFDPSILDIPY